MKEEMEQEIDLMEIFYYLRAKIGWLILAFVIGGLLAGSMTHFLIIPKYTAVSKIYMVSASSESVLNLSDLNLGTSLSEDYAELIKLRPVFNEVIDNLELDYDYEELQDMVSITKVGNTRLLAVTVESENPKEAQEIANEVADVTVTYIPKVMETSTPNIAEYAILPEEASSPNLAQNTIIGALVLLLILCGVYIVRMLQDDTVKSADEVQKEFGVMPLTVIPEGSLDEISDAVEHKNKGKKSKKNKKAGRR